MRFLCKSLLLVTFLMGWGIQTSFATHLRAGEITVERIGCSNKFQITITVYTNTGSSIRFGDGVLDWGDGSAPHITPTVQNTLLPELGPAIGTVSYKAPIHEYSGAGTYVISYLEANRNAGVLNMLNSVNTRFYIETKIKIDPFIGCDNSPRLLVPPIDKGCKGTAWYHNPGAYDPDGDSLSFELITPKKAKNVFVDRYQDPNNTDFYASSGIDYATANEKHTGQPTFSINPVTGTLIWDAPGSVGEYNIAFLIKEWRKVGGTYVNIGYVTRDMQIVIEDCANKRPELKIPPDVCVIAGASINQIISGTDGNFDDVKIEAFSQVLSIQPSPATISYPATADAAFYQKTGAEDAKLFFKWTTNCAHIKQQPYQVVFKITDRPAVGGGTPLVQFKTWNITVIGPAPVWNKATVNIATRNATLTWNSYACKNTATAMQIYRRVNSYPWTPPTCVTGIPDFLGYTKIADAAVNDLNYVDTNGGLGLAVGAQYCYRLVATFPSPGGGSSIVSEEICLDPIIGSAPIVTNVTIDKTDKATGQVTIKWRSPIGIDKAKFPSPYKFALSRNDGFSGKVNPKSFPLTSDSTLVDTGANTFDNVYNYKVQLIDANNTKLDTSASASTVRLLLTPKLKKIQLTWNAIVPWNNKTQKYPKHYIYRGPSIDGSLKLIDSVDVNQNLFNYIDSIGLNTTDTYCYQVMTKGSYGNKKLPEPLLNFSERQCAKADLDPDPCNPKIDPTTISATNCTDANAGASCGQNIFSNTLNWKRASGTNCASTGVSYNIYFAGQTGGEFTLIKNNVVDTFFVHSNLPSYAGCYKISAVNRSGKESQLSDAFCFDNCPYYELPNVFTPNGDNCNEKFSAYNDRDPIGEGGQTLCGGKLSPDQIIDLKKKCARFVNKVSFSVANRWGKQVFTYESGSEKSIYIDWDGKDNNGNELATGVYYYTATVNFNVVDPAKQNQIIKGWVQIIR